MRIPRRNPISLLLTLLILSSGCKKVDELTHFDLQTEIHITVPVNPIVQSPISINSGDIETGISEQLASYGSNTDLIEQVFLTSLTLEVQSPDTGTLDFLEHISMHLGAPGLPNMKVAWKEPVPDNTGHALLLDVWDVDLKRHFSKDIIRIRTDLTSDQATNSELRIKVTAVFEVDAKVLGI
jgi:hypothetical protein